MGVISHNTSFTHCPVLNLIVAWFGCKIVGNYSFSTNLWLTTLLCFRKRMQLNMGDLRLNTLFLYFLFHHLYLYFLFFFFTFPSFWSLYFFFLYIFYFHFLLHPMLILTGLSWCHKLQLHFISLMLQKNGMFIKIERFKMKPCPSQKKRTRVRGSNITQYFFHSLSCTEFDPRLIWMKACL